MRKTFFYVVLSTSLVFNLAGIGLAAWMVHRVGGPGFVVNRLKGGGNSAHYLARSEHFAQMPKTQGGIVFLGDSITQRCEWTEMLGLAGVRNRGIDGDKTSGVLARLDEVLADQPDLILLMIGINDLQFRSPDSAASYVEQIVQRVTAEAPDTQLILQSILPINNDIRNQFISPESILVYNGKLRRIADDFGLMYLDLHDRFADEQGRLQEEYTHDGIHLSGKGYALWREILVDEGILHLPNPLKQLSKSVNQDKRK